MSAAATGDAAPAGTALVTAETDRRLRKALVALSHADAGAAGALLVGLLPAQGAVIEGSLTYDLTVRGIGTFGVFVEDGSARVVRLSRKRPRNQALFHLAGRFLDARRAPRRRADEAARAFGARAG